MARRRKAVRRRTRGPDAMTRAERLQRVFRLSETEEQAECRNLGAAQRRLDEETAKLEELKAYRRSYGDPRNRPPTIGSLQWQDYQRFLDRLDEAIAVQARVVQDGCSRRNLHRRRWLAKRRQAESLERVVTRVRDEEAAAQERELQKLSDDLPRAESLFFAPGTRR